MSLSSIFIFQVLFHFYLFVEVVFHFLIGGRLSSWVKIRLHTENQPPRLSKSAFKVSLVVVGWGGGPTKYFVTPNLS